MKRHDGGTIDRDDYGLARTVVAVRTAVVVSIGLLLLIGPDWVRQHITATAAVLAAAMLYSLALLVNPRPEVRRTGYAWVVSFTDSVFTLTLIWLTGGLHSPVAAVLVLVVIASAARLIEVRQRWRSKNKIAEMSVPAWPMPIHHTKLMIAHPHITGCCNPQTPTPVDMR